MTKVSLSALEEVRKCVKRRRKGRGGTDCDTVILQDVLLIQSSVLLNNFMDISLSLPLHHRPIDVQIITESVFVFIPWISYR